MGLPREFVESCSSTEEFVCAICTNVVDFRTASYTSCSHVFCLSCLGRWLEARERMCPVCRSSLSYNGEVDLFLAGSSSGA